MPHDIPSDSAATGRTDHDILDLPLRGDTDTRRGAADIVASGSDELAEKYGINNLALLARLPSSDLVRSFPPDSKHLFWENALPDLIKHWRGQFTTLNTFDASTTAAGASKKRGAPDSAAGQPARKKRAIHDVSSTHGTRRSDKFQAT
jgi:hypothetical protein